MHPAIRILCFLILLVFLARTQLTVLVVYALVFFLLAAKNLIVILKHSSLLVLRLRWFWLSIILIYALMIPGEPVIKFFNDVAVTKAGLLEGFERCVSLLLVLMYFSLLNHYTDSTAWQAGIYWLLKPLRYFGISVERISLRLTMTMQAVSKLQAIAAMRNADTPAVSDWKQIPERISAMFNRALTQAEQQSAEVYTFEHEGIRFFQWLYPLLLFIVLWSINYFFHVM